jgi:hypothetical protein
MVFFKGWPPTRIELWVNGGDIKMSHEMVPSEDLSQAVGWVLTTTS